MLKTIITRKSDNVVTHIVTTAIIVENGLKVTDASGEYIIGFISECNQYDGVETADTIIPQKYTYTPTDGFVLCPNYQIVMTDQERIAELENQNAQILLALVNGGLM